jgi:DNA-binding NarL/FixJ family response regulator
MKKIKILLATSHPRIMREVMRQFIERQPDMEVVGEVLDLSALGRVALETAANVIIMALEDFEALGLGSRLLAECPEALILALAANGDAAFIAHVRLGRRPMADPSEAKILSALRQALLSLPETLPPVSSGGDLP